MSQPFSLLVKPASADCNLKCEYCFYLDTHRLYPQEATHRMSDEVLDRLIQSYMHTDQPVYSMIWQGGEPTLMGRDFYQRVIDLQKRYGKQGARIANSIQTNATMISPDLAAHFATYRFLAGCSLDGPPAMHDLYRRTRFDQPTQHLVLKGIHTLRSQGVAVNALVLVSQANVHDPLQVYAYLKKQGFTFIQFVPCVEFDAQGTPLPFSISGEEWGRFMLAIFHSWFEQDRGRISIRLFESILSSLVWGQAGECCFGARCNHYFVVEYNGDVFPCDFFVKSEYTIGNILDLSWSQIQDSQISHSFARLKQDWNLACETCPHQSLCMGDCLKFRQALQKGPDQLSSLCPGWKMFFDATIERFTHLARSIGEHRPPTGREPG